MKSIWHPYWKWECFHAGMFSPCDVEMEHGKLMYAEFLSDLKRFGAALDRVLVEWPVSCEHFLTKSSMNRIAWLGQASMCIATGLPRKYRGGFHLMSKEQQRDADALADNYLKRWAHENASKDSALR